MYSKNPETDRAVWMNGTTVFMIDQTKLPFSFEIFAAKTCTETCYAIKQMITRGAGSIGAAAAFAMAQGAAEAKNSDELLSAKLQIEATRPTARDLFAAVERVFAKAQISSQAAYNEAFEVAEETAQAGKRIGEYGNELIFNGSGILTHCNAGWLALQGFGSALSPIYEAHRAGKNIFVFADETRPRSQGARLTAWELNQAGVPHAVIADNAAAHFMQQGEIQMLITGADRIAANGDAANKIGTLEKAIAAKYFGIPFYIAAPLSTFDFSTPNGKQIPIEERSQDEVIFQEGPDSEGVMRRIQVVSPESSAKNPAFDVTPNSLISGYITEKGIFTADNLKFLK